MGTYIINMINSDGLNSIQLNTHTYMCVLELSVSSLFDDFENDCV